MNSNIGVLVIDLWPILPHVTGRLSADLWPILPHATGRLSVDFAKDKVKDAALLLRCNLSQHNHSALFPALSHRTTKTAQSLWSYT